MWQWQLSNKFTYFSDDPICIRAHYYVSDNVVPQTNNPTVKSRVCYSRISVFNLIYFLLSFDTIGSIILELQQRPHLDWYRLSIDCPLHSFSNFFREKGVECIIRRRVGARSMKQCKLQQSEANSPSTFDQ